MELGAQRPRPRVSGVAAPLVDAVCIFSWRQRGSFRLAQGLKAQREQKRRLPAASVA